MLSSGWIRTQSCTECGRDSLAGERSGRQTDGRTDGLGQPDRAADSGLFIRLSSFSHQRLDPAPAAPAPVFWGDLGESLLPPSPEKKLTSPGAADSIESGSRPREEIGERLPASNFPDPEDREQVARSELLQTSSALKAATETVKKREKRNLYS